MYPHASLVEQITYQHQVFPEVPYRYVDVSHQGWDELQQMIRDDPPDVAAFSVYTSTYVWALVIAAEIKRVNPRAVIVFGNDHASLLRHEILTGRYGRAVVDFVGTGNNGPFTMMVILAVLLGRADLGGCRRSRTAAAARSSIRRPGITRCAAGSCSTTG